MNILFLLKLMIMNLELQTIKEFDYELANSAKGQHIHFIVNNGPYSAHYSNNFEKELKRQCCFSIFI
jgi:hypothetical protein